MKTITIDDTGRVVRLGWQDKTLPHGAVEVGDIPEPPEATETEHPEARFSEGKIIWEMKPNPDAPEVPPEPKPEPTREEVRAARAEAYRAEVDPLTAEIARLRDMVPGDPRIAEAEAEREAAVARIVAAHPYPEEEEGGEA